jgi:dTDP-4-dehydrorhamnose reductase
MSVLILGAKGQLGQALKSVQPADESVIYADIEECDLTQSDAVSAYLHAIGPDYVVNCAAYTAVDRAESDRELCYRINRDAVQNVADALTLLSKDKPGLVPRLIHISTDFVFDGTSKRPYLPGDGPGPVSVYGSSKLAGEMAALTTMPEQVMIIRTAWLYYTEGANFVHTMLRLMAEKPELSVVDDQRGSPTFARSLASAIWKAITRDRFIPGIYHWTDAGELTWCEFARAIQAEAVERGLLSSEIPIHGITTDEYPTAASRPAYSVLDTRKLEQLVGWSTTPWRQNLGIMLDEVKANQN